MQTVYFDGCIIPHTQQFASMRRYTAAIEHTSNMAAVTIVDEMTSLSPTCKSVRIRGRFEREHLGRPFALSKS